MLAPAATACRCRSVRGLQSQERATEQVQPGCSGRVVVAVDLLPPARLPEGGCEGVCQTPDNPAHCLLLRERRREQKKKKQKKKQKKKKQKKKQKQQQKGVCPASFQRAH